MLPAVILGARAFLACVVPTFGSGDEVTIAAVRVPEVDAERMLDLRVRWSSMVSLHRAHMITTTRPALADEILGALPYGSSPPPGPRPG